MPTDFSPASSEPDRERFPGLKDDIGEDPARFLDRELIEGGDTDVSEPGTFIAARINAIDEIAVARAWIGVERRIDRGPRDLIIEMLEDRIDYLEKHGERDDQLATTVDPDAVPSTESVALWPDRDGNQRSAAFSRSNRAVTDGGEDRD